MERVKTYSATASIAINAPAAKVWDTLINPKQIKRYLHGTDTQTDWVVGHPIYWSGEWNGKSYLDKGEVLAFEPNERVSTSHWSPLSSKADKPENYHIVTYELSGGGDQTTLTVIHGNSPSQKEADDMIEQGWKRVLEMIKDIAEQSVS